MRPSFSSAAPKSKYSSAWLWANRWSETDFMDTNRTPLRWHTWAMAQPSISTSRGEKVSRIRAARRPRTANQSPVATRPVTAGWPSEARISAHRSGCQVGKTTWFTVDTRPMGSPTAVVSTSC